MIGKVLDVVEWLGHRVIAAISWAAPRAGWPLRGAGRALACLWTLAAPQYDTPPVTAWQAQARARSGCVGVVALLVLGPVVAVVGLALLAGWLDGIGGPVGVWAGIAGAVALLGWHGKPRADTPGPAARESTLVHNLRELLAAKLTGRTIATDSFRMSAVQPVYATDAGKIGRQITIGLPTVATAADVAQLAPNIAAVFGSRTDRVKVTEGTSPNQAIIFVADVSPSELPPAPWPLVDAHSFDVTRPVPIGTTPDGRQAGLELFSRDSRGDLQGHHLLLTGMSGYGKSTLLQLILSACALDSRAVLNVAVLKDTRDFEDIAPALSFLAVDASVEDLRAMLSRAVAHMATKAGVPYLVVIDEAQEQLGRNGDPEARDMMRSLLAKGRSAGVTVVLVTQEPTGPNLDPDLARRPLNRVSFWQSQNETAQRAMGSGMTDDTDPSRFGAGDKGLAAVIGTDGFRGRVKTPLIAPELVARIAQAHRREPVEVEFPTYALDHDDDVQDPEPAPDPDGPWPTYQPERTVLDQLLTQWPHDQDRASTPAMLMMLLAADPDRYAGWEPADVTKALRAAGVSEPNRGMKVGGRSARGAYRADVESARVGGCL